MGDRTHFREYCANAKKCFEPCVPNRLAPDCFTTAQPIPEPPAPVDLDAIKEKCTRFGVPSLFVVIKRLKTERDYLQAELAECQTVIEQRCADAETRIGGIEDELSLIGEGEAT